MHDCKTAYTWVHDPRKAQASSGETHGFEQSCSSSSSQHIVTKGRAEGKRLAYLLQGRAYHSELAPSMSVLPGCLGVSQDLVSSGQMGFVALALLLRHHHRQDHLCCGGPEARHLRTQPPEHVGLNGLPHVLLMMLLRRHIKTPIWHCLWIQVRQALQQGVIRCLHIAEP